MSFLIARRSHEEIIYMSGRRSFGYVRKLPSGRVQASYTDPAGIRRNAPDTFLTRGDADAWLSTVQTDLARGDWRPPTSVVKAVTFRSYAEGWLAGRDLKPRTRAHYESMLAAHVYPTFGSIPISEVTPVAVRAWHARLKTGPTARAHSYALLKTILATAVTDDLIPSNPCRVRGGGSVKRAKHIRPATLPELAALVEAMPERYRLMVLLASWCAMRFGELAELRRKDVDLKSGVVRIRRGVVRVGGAHIIGDPKSEAGVRDVAIPPHLIPLVRDHLAEHCQPGREGLLFPAANGGHLSTSTLYKVFWPARVKAEREDLRFHDLRHTGATLAAATGATLAELMARLGHSTPAAAMRYQHAAADRDRVIAAALSEMATVVPITAGKSTTRKAKAR